MRSRQLAVADDVSSQRSGHVGRCRAGGQAQSRIKRIHVENVVVGQALRRTRRPVPKTTEAVLALMRAVREDWLFADACSQFGLVRRDVED